ncbi:hypothetical protein DGMP_07550 [Desulfomarina profundi]|uniref:VanZ-like domain-containing protein n=1 Tax=Desulfomarina profundi TaxID=2772557 RepID=A0A8D5FUE3_9BACT|nr:VanZ family protein [Desulfomarina profundi]BCL60062.1 hypothetical protein DGMP_07550 [Desulfomarina profundi]
MNTRKVISIFILLVLLSLFTYHNVPRYLKISEQFLLNNDFVAGAVGWELIKTDDGELLVDHGEVGLVEKSPDHSIQFFRAIDMDGPGGQVVLQVTARSKNIMAGPKGWNKGRVILVQYFDGKPQYYLSHLLIALEGTTDWKTYRKVFRLNRATTEIKVILQLSHCTGELYCKDLSLYRVVVNPVYRVVKWLVPGGWLLFIFVLFLPVFKSFVAGSRLAGGVVLLVVAAILFGTMMPGSLKNDLKHDLVREVRAVATAVSAPGPGELKKLVDITKVAHFFLFMVLAFLLLRRLPQGRGWYFVILDLAMLAVGTELAQLFIDGRSALAGDVGIDMAGVFFALVMYQLYPGLNEKGLRAGMGR